MTLLEFNSLPAGAAADLLLTCCGSDVWVKGMLECRPFLSLSQLLEKADEVWEKTTPSDWLEAFSHHPKIGDLDSLKEKFASTAHLAGGEQGAVAQAGTGVLARLAKGNQEYENRFGFIFIVCATGKSAKEMLDLLEKRLPNDRDPELKIAAGEQHKITRLRLQKLIS